VPKVYKVPRVPKFIYFVVIYCHLVSLSFVVISASRVIDCHNATALATAIACAADLPSPLRLPKRSGGQEGEGSGLPAGKAGMGS